MLKSSFICILMLVGSGCAEQLVATVLLMPDPAFAEKNITGNLKIVQEKDGSVVISGTILHLNATSIHGFHVHAKGDITGGCKSTGSHFNPENVIHGAPNDTTRHTGDLGNVITDNDGKATINITDSIVSLSGKNSIIGRSIVVHSGSDDLGKGSDKSSHETGNAGHRWACGVIGIL